MVFVAARREVAEEIRGAMVYGRCWVAAPARTPEALRQQIHQTQPEVVLVDPKVPGALDAMPRVRFVRSGPKVVLLAETEEEIARPQVRRAGCYSAVVLSRPTWRRDLSAALAVALAASRQEQEEQRRRASPC